MRRRSCCLHRTAGIASFFVPRSPSQSDDDGEEKPDTVSSHLYLYLSTQRRPCGLSTQQSAHPTVSVRFPSFLRGGGLAWWWVHSTHRWAPFCGLIWSDGRRHASWPCWPGDGYRRPAGRLILLGELSRSDSDAVTTLMGTGEWAHTTTTWSMMVLARDGSYHITSDGAALAGD
jgi:hypothetical protein